VRYALRKIATLPILVLFVTFTCYQMMRSIGTKEEIVQGILNLNYTEQGAAQLTKELRLDKNRIEGYILWLWDAVRGDFGTSYQTRGPVWDLLRPTFGNSLRLMVMAIVLALAISMPLAIWSAYRPGSRSDRSISAVSFGFLSTPGFVVGLVLLFFVALGTRVGGVTVIPSNVFPTSGQADDGANFFSVLRHLFLPALALAIGLTANYMRVLRTDMVSTLQEDYVLLAKSKGLSDRYILLRHALRPSSFTLLTVAGISVGTLISGAVIVEQLFTINGTGNALLRAVFTRDMPTVLGGVSFITVLFVIATIAVDLLYGVLDPRVRAVRSLA
jgi:peptide/nickel transport system permease protein